ncbi:class I SAM-dependent RNA methyltransferase [Jongsikchunia kroppenstedtii]|uniref:class I SAM-dependent RNA methyltransferase n=1 Tax=Jongsikchunia kroppenstedtii TaxID=1121721 RepID=UPI00037B9662|nr:TRAM domain-containing protein [Jongsikchunia kroppenstedtii]
MNWQGETFELTVDRPGHGGVCVGRRDGRVVFVRDALPGERLVVRVTEDKGKSFCHAQIEEIVDAAAGRIEVACRAHAAGVGCCDASHMTGATARGIKATVLTELLQRVGDGIEWAGEIESLAAEPVPAAVETGWRGRMRLGVDPQGRPGMHARGGAVVPTLDCAAAADGLLADLPEAEAGSELVVVLDDAGDRHVVELAAVSQRRGGKRARAQQHRASAAKARRESVLAGSGVATWRVGDRTWSLPATGFWQSHRNAAASYSTVVGELLAASGVGRAAVGWDLFGGGGPLAGAMRDSTDEVHVVESDPRAVDAGGAAFADDAGVRFHLGRVDRAIAGLPSPDVVVLDPPRAGAGAAVVEAVSAAQPRAVVHVGCDQATFARDLADFGRRGYRPTVIRGFDAFPMTHHFEAIALLAR